MSNIKQQFLKFLVAGGTATTADFFVYTALYSTTGFDVAKAFSFLVGITISYLLNTYWTFAREKYSHQETFRFILLYLGIIALNVSINHMLLFFLPGEVILAFVTATGVSMVVNFIGQKWWVFKA